MKTEVIVTDNQLPPDVIKAIEDGRKVEAIKILREATGLGLANAKVLVDRAWRIHGPEKVPYSPMDPNNFLPNLVKSAFLAILLIALYFFYLKS